MRAKDKWTFASETAVPVDWKQVGFFFFYLMNIEK